MMFLAIGPWQILILILILLVPACLFILGYYIGKRVGAKKIREEMNP